MPMKPSARLYHCERCHKPVIICSRCDRNHIYCRDGCADLARQASRRRARQKYQSSRKGRLTNAQRQARYRAKKRLLANKVTHHSSPDVDRHVLLDTPSTTAHHEAQTTQTMTANPSSPYCHVCHGECLPFLRRHFIRPTHTLG